MDKLISIIMPIKNGEKYLKEAIEGIQRQQMHIEIIVVNDASTDKTEEIAKNLGCTVVTHPVTKGQVAGKNTGLKIAHGDYVMFHDGDDIMQEGALKVLYDTLEADQTISAVMAKVQDFVSPDCTHPDGQVIKKDPYYGLFTGAVLIRRKVFDIIGLFNEDLYTGEILDWSHKMALHQLKIEKVDIIAINRRIHDHNFGKMHRMTEFQNYAQILRARLKKNS